MTQNQKRKETREQRNLRRLRTGLVITKARNVLLTTGRRYARLDDLAAAAVERCIAILEAEHRKLTRKLTRWEEDR